MNKECTLFVQEILQNKLGICIECISQIFLPNVNRFITNDINNHPSIHECCPICFGTLNNHRFDEFMIKELEKVFQPYGGINRNTLLCKDAPTVTIPSILLIQAQSILAFIDSEIQNCDLDIKTSSLNKILSSSTANQIYSKVKECLRLKIRTLVHQHMQNSSCPLGHDIDKHVNDTAWKHLELSKDLHKEEAGYMNYHIILLPSYNVLQKLPIHILSSLSNIKQKKKERKRFRGNDPVEKQGGDPKINLEKRTKALVLNGWYFKSDSNEQQQQSPSQDEQEQNTINKAVEYSLLDRNSMQQIIESCIVNQPDINQKLGEWLLSKQTANEKIEHPNLDSMDCSIHATAWRNHFYLSGRYTKSRRDISQTPFYVYNDKHSSHNDLDNDDNDIDQKTCMGMNSSNMVRLGVSSVEEEICPIICDLGCKGISTLNNEAIDDGSDNKFHTRGKVVYGMCKFHASGREDMDVRMILSGRISKAQSLSNNHDNNNTDCNTKLLQDRKVTEGDGRPFVCEIIDALHMPTQIDLENIIRAINHMSVDEDVHTDVLKEFQDTDCKWVQEDNRINIRYGNNPKGVGISGLSYCLSSSYGNLQSETEDKVKFYGCLCWSEKVIPNQEYLEERLGIYRKGSNGEHLDESCIYPLRIEQSTPIRVLHRRAAAVRTRYVLSLSAKRINDNWFRLHLSTTAGTYVKEFVHGDCGRSIPSIQSLIGCRADILELDCEGIAI